MYHLIKFYVFVIDNDFALMHNSPSCYTNIGNYLKTTDEVREILHYFIDKDDIWDDFEKSLAHLN